MNWTFPIINTLDDVKWALEGPGGDDFIVVDKLDKYLVINYVKISNDTFRTLREPDIGHEEYKKRVIRREFRGLIFDKATKKLIRRPFHKFHNLNEREETLTENVDFTQPFVILDKLDGSMIAPFITSDGILRFGTKLGETSISQQALSYAIDAELDFDLIREVIEEQDTTVIFEWCSNENQIVVSYPKPRLVITACRDMLTGTYWSMDEIHACFDRSTFEIVGHFKG